MKLHCVPLPPGHVLYLDVFVVLPEVQETMVGSHRLGKLSNVDAHHDEVLPDLPLLKVAPEGFLEGPEGLFSAATRHKRS